MDRLTRAPPPPTREGAWSSPATGGSASAPLTPWWRHWWVVAASIGLFGGLVAIGLFVGPRVVNDMEASRLLDRSYLAAQEGDDEAAIEEATAAIVLGPDGDTLAKAYGNRGSAHGALGQFEAAIADTTAAIELASDDETRATAYAIRGLAHSMLAEYELAESDFLRSKDLTDDERTMAWIEGLIDDNRSARPT